MPKKNLKDGKTSKRGPAMENALLDTIKNWVSINKKVFWKYEVSSFYQTYKIIVGNLPVPSEGDIKVVSNNRLLSNAQKTQLCGVIKKECTKAGAECTSSINVQIDYVKGAVIAAVF
jgi:hypothetical protein